MSSVGELHIISGSMFSGKTTELLNLINKSNNYIVINHSLDDRYSSNNVIYSHNGKSINCYKLSIISSIFDTDEFKTSSTIFIDEAQFFSNLKKDVIKIVEEYNKTVYIAGLLIDFNREQFGELLDLIPFADTFTLKKSNCSICQQKFNSSLTNTYSYKFTKTDDIICIGTNKDYTSLCRYHYLKK
jgi:thymidine kinase